MFAGRVPDSTHPGLWISHSSGSDRNVTIAPIDRDMHSGRVMREAEESRRVRSRPRADRPCYNKAASVEMRGLSAASAIAGRLAHERLRQWEGPMIDKNRRAVLATGAAVAATAGAPQVFAQSPQAGATPQAGSVQGLPAGAKVGFYEKGNVRIRYAEIGSGFPLLAMPGGGLNSAIPVWARAVINIPEEFKNDFRVITMDQRNATGGESTGPVPVDDPWSAFADDQLGVMDHLGIRQFFFFGNCIGGPFAMKLMERAPERVAAAVLSQPVGHRPEQPDYMYNAGVNVWAKELRDRRPDVTMETIETY